jgi:hypothetical protein
MDWDSTTRIQRIDILDAATGAVLDTRTISSFNTGQYLVWTVSGHVTIQATWLGGWNAIVNGLFFDPVSPPAPAGGTSATFSGFDATTAGNWAGVYGHDGLAIANEATSYPGYATVTLGGQQSWTWAATTTDSRALQRGSGSGRIASTWFSSTSFTLDINLSDGAPHQVAIYVTDWDALARVEQVDVLDASTGAVLDSRTVSSFVNGGYLVWTVRGHVTIRATCTGGLNAVISGLFFE